MARRRKSGKAVKRAGSFVVTNFTPQSLDALSRSIRGTQAGLRGQVQNPRFRQSVRAYFLVPREEMFLRAPSPRSHKIIVQSSADAGTQQRNQSPRPFL